MERKPSGEKLLASTAVSRVVQTMMQQKGITQKQLAEMTGLRSGTISRILRGTSSPAPDSLAKIMDALRNA